MSAVDAVLVCVAAAIGLGAFVADKVALGVLCFILLGWNVAGWIVRRRGSDATVMRFALSRPLFFGGWLVALAGAIIAGRTNLDWVLILPLGLAYLGLGVWSVRLYRSSDRGGS